MWLTLCLADISQTTATDTWPNVAWGQQMHVPVVWFTPWHSAVTVHNSVAGVSPQCFFTSFTVLLPDDVQTPPSLLRLQLVVLTFLPWKAQRILRLFKSRSLNAFDCIETELPTRERCVLPYQTAPVIDMEGGWRQGWHCLTLAKEKLALMRRAQWL